MCHYRSTSNERTDNPSAADIDAFERELSQASHSVAMKPAFSAMLDEKIKALKPAEISLEARCLRDVEPLTAAEEGNSISGSGDRTKRIPRQHNEVDASALAASAGVGQRELADNRATDGGTTSKRCFAT